MRDAPTTELIRLDRLIEPPDPSRLTIDRDAIGELASSIARLGLLEPIGVRPIDPPGTYAVVYGHRRLLAVRSLGWFTIPAIILPADVSELDARQAENNQRVQLTPVEEAHEIRRYIQAGETVGAIAQRLARSAAWVQTRVRLLTYQDDILDAIHNDGLALSVADQLTHVEHNGYRVHLTHEALRNGATAATAAVWVQHYQAERPRIEANQTTIEEIAARRDDYKVHVSCEYCGNDAELSTTRVWRLCGDCSAALVIARRTPAPVSA